MPSTAHPYYPTDLILEDYRDNLLSFPLILGVFTVGVVIASLLSWASSRRLPLGQRLQVPWFVSTALIHIVVEGAFVLNVVHNNEDPNMFLLELWKEYGKADSRYITRDSFIVSVEFCTAFAVGPLCLLVALGIFAQKPWRFPLIFLVSICQFYGTVFYFMTCWLDDFKDSRPEPLYFWFMFVFMNAIWLVIPAICTWDAACKVTRAVAAFDSHKKKA